MVAIKFAFKNKITQKRYGDYPVNTTLTKHICESVVKIILFIFACSTRFV